MCRNLLLEEGGGITLLNPSAQSFRPKTGCAHPNKISYAYIGSVGGWVFLVDVTLVGSVGKSRILLVLDKAWGVYHLKRIFLAVNRLIPTHIPSPSPPLPYVTRALN